MQDNDDFVSTMTLQQKAQFVVQKMGEGDLRAEWFFDKLSKRLGISQNEAVHATVITSTGINGTTF